MILLAMKGVGFEPATTGATIATVRHSANYFTT
jgi:hypothetical protein